VTTATRKCAHCGDRFRREAGIVQGLQAWCSEDHKIEWAIQAGRKRLKVKTRSEWLKEAQASFNAYIRARDERLPCISCGRNNNVKMNAGHYRSVGSMPALRFEPLNCWKQCEACNSYLSGNLIEYRKELLMRIGPDRLAWLEGPHEVRKYTVEQIKAIKTEYRDKRQQLEARTA
jgi:hypothetical protein